MPTLNDITDAELGTWKSVCKTPSDKALIQIAFNLAHIYDMLKAIKEDTMCYGDYFESVCATLSDMQECNPYKPLLMSNFDIGYPTPEEHKEPDPKPEPQERQKCFICGKEIEMKDGCYDDGGCIIDSHGNLTMACKDCANLFDAIISHDILGRKVRC